MRSGRRPPTRSSPGPAAGAPSGSLPFRRIDGDGVRDDELELGVVNGVFGVTGEVRLFLHNQASDTLADGLNVVLVRPDGARFATRMRARPGAGKRIIARIEGLTDRELAASLKDWRVAIALADLPEPEEGEFYVIDLEGLPVFCGGVDVGTVATVHATPGGDVIEIETAGDPLFVPMIEQFVIDVDVEEGRVTLSDDALDGQLGPPDGDGTG